MTKANVQVYENSISESVIARFSDIESLVEWNKAKNVSADQVSVNNFMLLGWDELYDFIDR